MKDKPRPWAKEELALLGKLPDAEVADLTGRTLGTVWQKRRALGIHQQDLRFREWTPAEDKLVGTSPDAEIARQLGRTESAIKSRRAILEREQANRQTNPILSNPRPSRATFESLRRCRARLSERAASKQHSTTPHSALPTPHLEVPRDPSLADEDAEQANCGTRVADRTGLVHNV